MRARAKRAALALFRQKQNQKQRFAALARPHPPSGHLLPYPGEGLPSPSAVVASANEGRYRMPPSASARSRVVGDSNRALDGDSEEITRRAPQPPQSQ